MKINSWDKRKGKHAMTSIFKADGKSITDPVIIAKKFCQYFFSIGPTLAKKIPSVIVLPLLHSYRIITYPLPTNQFELQNICRAFKSWKSPGYDRHVARVGNSRGQDLFRGGQVQG